MSTQTIFLPVLIPTHEPARCPSCQNIEDIKTICRKCGHEYTEKPDVPWTMADTWIVLLGVLAAFWATVTLISWIGDSCNANFGDPWTHDRCSLTDVLHTQQEMLRDFWRWLTSLRVTG